MSLGEIQKAKPDLSTDEDSPSLPENSLSQKQCWSWELGLNRCHLVWNVSCSSKLGAFGFSVMCC